jgi:hypothetical protein
VGVLYISKNARTNRFVDVNRQVYYVIIGNRYTICYAIVINRGTILRNYYKHSVSFLSRVGFVLVNIRNKDGRKGQYK